MKIAQLRRRLRSLPWNFEGGQSRVMKSAALKCLFLLAYCNLTALSAAANEEANAMGPLVVHPENPRYFKNSGSGELVYLTGSHVWYNLVDMGPEDPPQQFDFEKYLDWLEAQNHNFIRLWTWELSQWNTANNSQKNETTLFNAQPHPWKRTGPGMALDGKPKFDLTQPDPEYFGRLRSRIAAARDRGIYVSVMLFEAWGVQFAPNGWRYHPFNKENNINGIDGDGDGDGKGIEIYEAKDPAVVKIQAEYVRHLIHQCTDFDNILYEICNEAPPSSTPWQYSLIEFINYYESNKTPHPVGMTFQYKGGDNATLFKSPAHWISPNQGGGYKDNPPANDGSKVILSDTDHLWGIGGDREWVWKSFLRGLNPIFMDPYDGLVLGRKFDPKWDPVRKAMGQTLRWANRVNLVAMTPRNELSSTEYCLANPGGEYLVYAPVQKEFTLDLTDADGALEVQWFDPETDETRRAKAVTGGKRVSFSSPFEKPGSLLYVHALVSE